MGFKENLLRPVRDYFDVRVQGGRYGVEIECEGERLPNPDHIAAYGLTQWEAHTDNSLRGLAWEYTLARPLSYSDVITALDDLNNVFKKHGTVLKMSRRTSVHVHLNVQDMPVMDVYTIASVYLLLEDLLVTFSGPERVGNLFCLRSEDAELLPLTIASSLRHGGGINDFTSDTFRYASLNFAALRKFGSVEFRSFRGTENINEIKEWLTIIDMLYENTLKHFKNPREVYEKASRTSPLEFLEMIFEPEIVESLVQVGGWDSNFQSNLPYLLEIAYALDNWPDPTAARKEIGLRHRLSVSKSKSGKPRAPAIEDLLRVIDPPAPPAAPDGWVVVDEIDNFEPFTDEE